jgi:hypothetical protein
MYAAGTPAMATTRHSVAPAAPPCSLKTRRIPRSSSSGWDRLTAIPAFGPAVECTSLAPLSGSPFRTMASRASLGASENRPPGRQARSVRRRHLPQESPGPSTLLLLLQTSAGAPVASPAGGKPLRHGQRPADRQGAWAVREKRAPDPPLDSSQRGSTPATDFSPYRRSTRWRPAVSQGNVERTPPIAR